MFAVDQKFDAVFSEAAVSNAVIADTVIVGAGMLGLSLAYHLRLAGQCVVVLERERDVAVHASGKNAGMIRHLYRHYQLTEWTLRSVRDWPARLKQEFFRQSGSLVVGREVPGHHQELFEQRQVYLKTHDIKLPAVYCAQDGLLNSRGFLGGLAACCRDIGVEIRLACVVSEARALDSGWMVRTDQGDVSASVFVNAAGAWLNPVSSSARVAAAGVQAFARHLFVTDGWLSGTMPIAKVGFIWDEHYEWYVRDWSDTQRLVSLCDEVAGDPDTFSSAIDPRERLFTKLHDEIPEQARALKLAETWSCFRTYTEDKLPVMGFDPSANNYFWLGAFGGFGMSTGFGAAFEASKAILSGSSAHLSEFCVTRTRQTG